MDISGPYPTAPDGAKYLLHAANNKYNFVWVCGMAKKSDATKSLAAFAATFDAIGLKPQCIISDDGGEFRNEFETACESL